MERAKILYRHIDDDYRTHADHKPGFWARHLLPRRPAVVRRGPAPVPAPHRSERPHDQPRGLLAEQKAELTAKLTARQRAENALRDTRHAIAITRTRIDAATERWPGTVPFGDDLDDEALQLLIDILDTDHRPFLQVMHAHRVLWRRTGDPDPFLSYVRTRLAADEPPSTMNWPPILDLLTELGPAAAPLHPTLRSFAIRDEQVTTYEPGDTPGIADEQIRTAIQTTADHSS